MNRNRFGFFHFFVARRAWVGRLLLCCLCLCVCWLAFALNASAEQAKVTKVLPQFLDKMGRHALSASLYERDAYQFYLRKHPKERMGLRLAVQWKADQIPGRQLTLRAELRGAIGNTLHNKTLEEPLKKTGWLGNWSEVRMTGEEFQEFGELVAWRVTLLDGARPIAQQESFLWSPITPGNSTR
jgi:hypothetical protein